MPSFVWAISDSTYRPWLASVADAPDTHVPYSIRDTVLATRVAADIAGSPSLQAKMLMLRSLAAARGLTSLGVLAGDTLARTLEQALRKAGNQDLDVALGLESSHSVEFAFAVEPSPQHAADNGLSHIWMLTDRLDREMSLAGELNGDFDFSAWTGFRVRDLITGAGIGLLHAQPRNCAAVIGQALSAVLLAAPGTREPATFTDLFTLTFLKAAGIGIGERGYLAAPDALTATLNYAAARVRPPFRSRDPSHAPWAAVVADRLEVTAGQVFDRRPRERPLQEIAPAIRLPALCLAAEADHAGAPEVGDMFREVAAGITLLELRATGQIPPVEAIMLAVE